MAGIFLAYSLLASTLLIVVWVVYKCVLANTDVSGSIGYCCCSV